jgi:hypothetical protein
MIVYFCFVSHWQVDVSFVGHVHAYERTVPMFNHVANGQGMITIVNGNGGNSEGLATGWVQPQPSWYGDESNQFVVSFYHFRLLFFWYSVRFSRAGLRIVRPRLALAWRPCTMRRTCDGR